MSKEASRKTMEYENYRVNDDYDNRDNRMNEYSIKPTRAGLLPSREVLPYIITTSDVENYIQRKMNVVINGMRKENLYNGKDIDVRVITVEMGNKFVPFTVLLPTSVLKDKKKRPVEELSVFNPKDEDNTVIVYDPIMKMFSSYLYNKADGEAFFSQDWRRERGVSTTTSAVLKKNRLPIVQKLNNGSMEMVTFLIDPIRVFYDMLIMDDYPADFQVEIKHWQKIRSGEFRYHVDRVVKRAKNKKGKGGNLADEINRKMHGNNN